MISSKRLPLCGAMEQRAWRTPLARSRSRSFGGPLQKSEKRERASSGATCARTGAALAATTNGTATNTSAGFWYVTAAGTDYGKAGAYSDGSTQTSDY